MEDLDVPPTNQDIEASLEPDVAGGIGFNREVERLVVLIRGRGELHDVVSRVVAVPELQPLECVGLIHQKFLEVPSDFHFAIVRVSVGRHVRPTVRPVDLCLGSPAVLAVLRVEVQAPGLDLAASRGLVVDVGVDVYVAVPGRGVERPFDVGTVVREIVVDPLR